MHDWDQSALIWAMIANTVRDPKQHRKPFSPGLVHPFRSEKDYDGEEHKTMADLARLFER